MASAQRTTRDLFSYCDDNQRTSVVYMATNRKNGKRYIGLTRQGLSRRKIQHASAAARGEKGAFYRAVRRYGFDSFEWAILASCETYREAAKAEISLIARMAPEYNMSLGGDGLGGIGTRASAATRKRLSAAKLGRPGPWAGKKRSVESISKRTATRALNPVRPWLGKKRDPETMEKIAQKLRRWVVCLDDGKRHHGLKAAAEAYGIPRHREIAKVCSGKAKTIHGLRFVYEAEA